MTILEQIDANIAQNLAIQALVLATPGPDYTEGTRTINKGTYLTQLGENLKTLQEQRKYAVGRVVYVSYGRG